MPSPGYLHNWLQENYTRIWSKRTCPPRLMGANQIIASHLDGALLFGKTLVSRFSNTFPAERRLPIEFEILDIDEVGAWAVWPAHCYGVLFSKALIVKIEKICAHAKDVMRIGMKAPTKSTNFLEELWHDLPQNEDYLNQFGTLINQIAFSFIIHHELAHAGLGHERALSSLGPGVTDDESVGFHDLMFWDEFAAASSEVPNSTNYLKKQAIETDADVHGMFYTRRFLREEIVGMLSQISSLEENILMKAWKVLLRDAKREQLMLFIGVAIGLLALQPNLEAEQVDSLNTRSHPPPSSRLLLAIHVVGSITKYDRNFWENRSAAITSTIMLIARYEMIEIGKKLRMQEFDHADSAISGSAPSARDRWHALRHISVVDAWLREKELAPYWEMIISELRIIYPRLAKHARYPDFMRYEWHRLGNLDSPSE